MRAPRSGSAANVEAIEGIDAILAASPAQLPARRCAVCGSSVPGGRVVSSPLYHSSRWIYLLFFVSLLVALIAYLATRRRVDVSYYICPKCAAHRAALRAFVAVIMPSAFALLIVAAIAGSPGALLGSAAALLLSPLLLMTKKGRGPYVRALDTSTGSFLLGGVHHEVVDALRTRPEALPPYAAPTRPALPEARAERALSRAPIMTPRGTDGGA